MAVVGRHALVVEPTGKTTEVKAFSPDCNVLEEVPIVNAVVKWIHPYEEKECLLLINNALHVPSMDCNLVPPFLMREAGVIVNEVPKIHVRNPSVEDHSLYFTEEKMRIPLSLTGIFSFFPTEKPSMQDIENCDLVLTTTPGPSFDPHDTAYAANEANMLDYQGDMIEKQHKQRILLSEVN